MILLNIIFKNFKIILRSPFTIVLLILAPILLMFIVGFTYSGVSFTQTNVGVIDYEGNFFNGVKSGITFIEYLGNESANHCRNDLKTGKLELCIFLKEIKDSKGKLNGASVIYYVDNTRPQISNALIRNFNLIIDKKTKDISIKTISSIFSEMDDAVIFMNDSKKLLDDIRGDIILVKVAISDLKVVVSETNSKIDESYNILVDLRNTIKTSFDDAKKTDLKLITQLSDLDETLDNLYSSSYDLEVKLKSLKSSVSSLGNLELINQLDSSIKDLETISNSLVSSQKIVQNLLDNLNSNNFNSFDEIITNVDDMLKLFLENKNQMSEVEKNINSFEDVVNQRESKLNEIEIVMDEKLDYFTQISSKDASNIAEPISKKIEPVFKHFKRVHQLAPTVVVLILLFVGLLLSNIIVSLEINSKAYFRNLISPISQFQFILGLFITSFILVSFQLLFLFLVLVFYFSVPIFLNFVQLGIVIVHLLFVFVLLGIFLAYFFSSVQLSILVTTFVMLFMFLLSDLIVPIEIMPNFMANIISLNPVVLGGDLIRKVFYFKDYYSLNISDMIPFYVIIFILILLIWYSNYRRKKFIF